MTGPAVLAATAPLEGGDQYVAAAYLVFIVLLIVYVGIMAAKLGRIAKQIEALAASAEGKPSTPPPLTELEAEAEAGATGETETE